ncbi:serine O-acetyltransferase [Helicobacter cinaedi PAGU611]|uniref:hypothetical protein n=1 Tax=Helicobacter cinaedi TaxID=213 RepID=UPI00025D3469|nr:hypothetical protein [Helicobacter cinaedi]AWK61917.1 serine O-acetyltransferase [Helicobacter cinaedi]QOQ96018.1 hypothetical protein HW245_10655 [Helicobacter cinaedi]BAM12343.1 serine O-acetyltransferase [Helicobacter cinaedi PAGU611]
MLTSKVLLLVQGQIDVFFSRLDSLKLESSDVKRALDAFWRCNKQICLKYYETQLSIEDFYHTDKYATFLYFLSHSLYKADKAKLATKVYYLNKILHGIDIYYEICLPEVFYLTHPVGSVFGRAGYGNYLCVYQNCTIGGDTRDGEICYPTLGEGVVLCASSKVIGKCQVGDNVIFGANAFIINTDVPSNSIVVGSYPHHRILPSNHNVLKEFFGIDKDL